MSGFESCPSDILPSLSGYVAEATGTSPGGRNGPRYVYTLRTYLPSLVHVDDRVAARTVVIELCAARSRLPLSFCPIEGYHSAQNEQEKLAIEVYRPECITNTT